MNVKLITKTDIPAGSAIEYNADLDLFQVYGPDYRLILTASPFAGCASFDGTSIAWSERESALMAEIERANTTCWAEIDKLTTALHTQGELCTKWRERAQAAEGKLAHARYTVRLNATGGSEQVFPQHEPDVDTAQRTQSQQDEAYLWPRPWRFPEPHPDTIIPIWNKSGTEVIHVRYADIISGNHP